MRGLPEWEPCCFPHDVSPPLSSATPYLGGGMVTSQGWWQGFPGLWGMGSHACPGDREASFLVVGDGIEEACLLGGPRIKGRSLEKARRSLERHTTPCCA